MTCRRHRLALSSLLVTLLASLCFRGDLQADPPLRRADDRTQINAAQVKALGISEYRSQHLILYSDTAPERARQVVGLVDLLLPTWERQLGTFPQARDHSEFQITGYLMQDPEKFTKAGLVRPRIEKIIHGQHSGYEFWMHDTDTTDYYRGHLLLHEASHCIMQCLDDRLKPIWYLEGMAEYFGSHAAAGQDWKFGVMPASQKTSLGFGRIEMIQKELAEGRALSAAAVMQLGPREFSESRSIPYAWSWALCTFLANHSRYADDFRAVCHQWETDPFRKTLDEFWKKHARTIEPEWEIFRNSLCYGWDLERGGCVFEAPPLEFTEAKPTATVDLRSDQGWQSTGLRLQAGDSLQVTATGRVQLGKSTKPWESEPQGISLRYSEQRPIGRLLGAMLRDQPHPGGPLPSWEILDLGPQATINVKSAGILFLRVNDRWNELSDNSGTYQITLSRPEKGPAK